jgi:hypothetical protein
VLFTAGDLPPISELLKPNGLGRHHLDFDHSNGERELWIHGSRQSGFSEVRFNAVGPGLLKTSASAGIPGYVDAYLYAEKVIPRKRAVETQEAANVVAFLLSPRSSGITAQTIVVDAGMEINYFDQELIDAHKV